MSLFVILFAVGAFACGMLLLYSRHRQPGSTGIQSTDVRDSVLGALAWPVLGVALIVVLISRWVRELLPSQQPFFNRLPDGRLADAMSVCEIAAATSDEEQAAPLILVVGGVGKVRVAAKAGLCPATYIVDGRPTAVREMVYIGEVAHSYESVPSFGVDGAGSCGEDFLHCPEAGSDSEQGTPKQPVASHST